MKKLPIFSAKKIASDEEVIGVAYEDKNEKCIYISNDTQNLYSSAFKIDTSTLKISFDNGKSFFELDCIELENRIIKENQIDSMSDVQDILDFVNTQLEKNKQIKISVGLVDFSNADESDGFNPSGHKYNAGNCFNIYYGSTAKEALFLWMYYHKETFVL